MDERDLTGAIGALGDATEASTPGELAAAVLAAVVACVGADSVVVTRRGGPEPLVLAWPAGLLDGAGVVGYQAAFALPAGSVGELCVAVNRTGRDFTGAEVDRLMALRRTLGVAARRFVPAEPGGGPLDHLSGREAEVLDLVAGGLASDQVARSLRVSCRTVHKHLEHIYAKLDVHNRTEAAGLWHRRRPPVGPGAPPAA